MTEEGGAAVIADMDKIVSTTARKEQRLTKPAGDQLRAVVRTVRATGTFWILLALLTLLAAFCILVPDFASAANVRNITLDAASLLILACGQTFVILTAGIDLSVGSTLIFASVVSAQTMLLLGGAEAGWGTILVGFLASIAAGAVWGLFNGRVVAFGRVPPLITTLGTLGMALGGAQLLSGGVDVREVPTLLNDTFGSGRWLGIPLMVIVAFAVIVVAGAILATTRFGRYTRAIGSNEEAARRAGINVNRHLMKVYTLSGVLAGLAGFLNVARFSTTTIAGHTTDNLSTIAAVVIGGTSPFGGIGTMLGTGIGVFIPAVLQNGFIVAGVQPFWQTVAVGAVLVLAVYFDIRRRRNRTRV